jgi:molecular chaperone HtpG
VRLVVDSADLPLNVSREMIQESAVFSAIRKGLTNRVVQELSKLAETEPEKYAKVWEHFGAALKEGLYEDPERRDGIFKIARFATTTHPSGDRTLAQYVASLRENQTAIYYLTGDDAKRLAASPQLEGFRARGVEVLLLSDPVDAFWVSTAAGFDGKPFKSVSQGAADIKSIALVEGAKAPEAATGEVATLFAFFKQTLEGEVADVRGSDRLTDSVACLIAPEFGPDRQLEKMLAAHGRLSERAKPILEINPTHPLTVNLAGRFGAGKDKPLIEDAAWLMLDEARLLEGGGVEDPPAFAARLRRVLEKALG